MLQFKQVVTDSSPALGFGFVSGFAANGFSYTGVAEVIPSVFDRE